MTADLHSGEPRTVALALAQLGVPILPVHAPTADRGCTCWRGASCADVGKHPRLHSGIHGASVDPALIRGWLDHWPATNIGAACLDRLVVLDVDAVDEVRALHNLCAGRRLGGLRVRTGRRDGWHVWFDHPGGPLRTRVAGILVRSGPSYVVAPPSLHASGIRYAFVSGALEPPPTWLVDELRPFPAAAPTSTASSVVQPASPADRLRSMLDAADDEELTRIAVASPSNHVRYGQRVVATAVERILAADPGSRHATLNKSAFTVGGYLAACGLDCKDVIAALSAAAEEAGLVSDADREQTARTILRGLEAGAARPRTPERVS